MKHLSISRKWFRVFLSLILYGLLFIPSVYACLGGNPPISSHVTQADVVLEGVVLNSKIISPTNWYKGQYTSYNQEVTIAVKQYIKGNGPEIVKIYGFGKFSESCFPTLILEYEHAIFFASRNKNNNNLWESGMENPTTINLQTAINASGQTPIPKIPFINTFIIILGQVFIIFICPMSLLFCIILFMSIVIWRIYRRKQLETELA